jgi:glycosyltransferase involved in cell wall biosynthesis
VLVTVVTPTLNGGALLKDCIESVKNQTGAEFSVEHIIVDGGSVDGTVELAKSYGLDVITGKDRGIFDAINKGSFQSSGELIGFLGADDLLLEGGLAEVVRRYKTSGRSWVCGGIRVIDSGGRNLGENAALPSWLTAGMHACLGWGSIGHMGTYVSRDLFTSLNGFDISYTVAGDYEFFCRARSKAPYARSGRTLACWRKTGENYSMKHLKEAEADYERVMKSYAPVSETQQLLYRAMNLWRYARNPGWASRKFADQGRFPFASLYGRA